MLPEDKHPNALINASSPYLLQHAYNPVEWNEWSNDVIQRASDQNKLLIISIGYAACHWCHVMEQESFEKEEVAEWMNNFYVNIKVDREERPDIDAVYMNAAQLTTGRGGWPLNVIALPDGRPVFAGTYFPKDNWIRILQHFEAVWKKSPEELKAVADKIEEGLHLMENEHSFKNKVDINQFDKKIPTTLAENIYFRLDLQKGGLDKAPKFPMPCVFDFLINYNYFQPNNNMQVAIDTTLTQMMQGGIYDQAGGGFARYSVDEYWFAPHFEKMLYDNGQLISLYSKGYVTTNNKEYKRIVDETIDWITREMTSPENLFYSSLDADSEGVEGKFYCFTKKEIFEIVRTKPEIFCDYFSIEEEGNWEHSNILHIKKDMIEFCQEYSITEKELRSLIHSGKQELLEARSQRTRPGLDDKQLTAWNALAISGLCRAFQVANNHSSIQFANNAIRFLLDNLKQTNGLFFRNYKNRQASIPGFLDDQVFMMEALVEMYRSNFKEEYLLEAKQLMDRVLEHYYDETSGGFFYTGKDQQQPVLKTKEVTDNVIPSANSAMANMLFSLGHYFQKDEWIRLSLELCFKMKEQAEKYAPYYSNWGNCMLSHIYGGTEVIITGTPDHENLRQLYQIPGIILMFKENEKTDLPLLYDKPLSVKMQIYICKNKTCGLPVNTVQEAVVQIQELASRGV